MHAARENSLSVARHHNTNTHNTPAQPHHHHPSAGNAEGARITFNLIKQRMGDVLYKLTSQKFEDPGGFCSVCGVGGRGDWVVM